jgi:two-component system chemotaxis response regulator CheB
MTLTGKVMDSYRVPEAPIRVLVVDDSAFMRFTITKRLSETPGMLVVGAAHDGEEALQLIPKLNPDVVTLDVEMPHMDGLATLRQIMAHHPRPVIMLSSLTTDGARETVQALTWGAVDFISKPTAKANIDAVMDEVIHKIQRAARARVFAMPINRRSEPNTSQQSGSKTMRALRAQDRVVIIGSSTGGPRALGAVIPMLPGDLPAALLIVQHMPVGFTRSLAERLDSLSPFSIKEAAPGDSVEVGRGLLAPGGFHMTIDPQGQIAVNQNPPVHGVRPAVDVTMTSLSQRYGSSVIAVVLTGMGSDGTNGAALIHSSGGYVIAEDESTSVVWGMPRSVIEAGAADEIVPLPEVAKAIERAVRR